MGRHLLRAFASEDPRRFAQVIASMQEKTDIQAVLENIPEGLECEVLSHLTPEAASGLLNMVSDKQIAGWLDAASADVGRRMLAHLAPERIERTVAGVGDKSKRRSLLRLTRYPPESIGALVNMQTMVIPETATAAEIATEIQHLENTPDGPVVILTADGNVKGVLDLVAFLRNQDELATAADFCTIVRPLYAEASRASMMDREEWSYMTSLPVVDFEEKLVGFVTRSAMEQASGSHHKRNLFFDSSVELSTRFFQFLVYMMGVILDRGSRP